MRFKLFRQNGALNSPPIFDAFQQGVKHLGHTVVDDNEDVAVIWSVLWNGRMLRNEQIYKNCLANNKPVIIIEVGNLHRGNTWRICLNHINGLGTFANDENLDENRPAKLGIVARDAILDRPKSILIATQHDKSLQWQGMPSMSAWTMNTIEAIRKHTDMPIYVRPHPRCPMPSIEIEFKNVFRQHPVKIDGTYDDFDMGYNYHCVINHNAGPPIHAAINGTPIICHSSSLAYPVSDTMENILNPVLPDRTEWLVRLSHTEWTVQELQLGIPVKRLESAILSQLNS